MLFKKISVFVLLEVVAVKLYALFFKLNNKFSADFKILLVFVVNKGIFALSLEANKGTSDFSFISNQTVLIMS